ncbi:MAG: Zn-dependent hydrolase [Leptolyngbyaceae cyanobacterium bins.302]|nr:Zn-dependent hydrolase [Leptolyngbyaceae cyanobacterium bins.302]
MTVATMPLLVNRDRLTQSIQRLAEVGQLPNGGVCRIAFSMDDLLARQLVHTWMEEAGMTVRVDAAGNIIGRYDGKQPNAPALATGSHIDTVPVGGHFDGCLGVLAGIEVVRTLHENGVRLHHALEVIVFTDEERSVIGSKAMSGQIKEGPDYYCRLDGTPIQPCLEKVGGNWEQIHTARRDRSEIAAFVELHVEQGGVLEYLKRPVGVVTGVVGQYRFALNIVGCPNHAGTTPMSMRKDALVAASQIVLAVNQLATETSGDQVATVGFLNVSPNATNTVPGKVDLRIDLRDLSEEHLSFLVDKLEQEIQAIARATDTQISMRQTLHIHPTLSAPHIMGTIEQVCEEMGCPYSHLPSRAGHDAQEIGRITDMGMIFVPSRHGISHSEEEYTSPEECEKGANVLLKTFLKLDQVYSDRK